MKNFPPLLIIANLEPDFVLNDLELDVRGDTVLVKNTQSHSAFEDLEIIFGGLTFTLSFFNPQEVTAIGAGNSFSCLECERPDPKKSAIGISLGEHIADGQNVPIINRALLEVGKHIGKSITASHAVWHPANQFISFEYYDKAVQHYIDGGPLPALVQINISKSEDGDFTTKGLHYFAKQELIMSASTALPDNKLVQRLVRIARDIAVNGPIPKAQNINGMDENEIISFVPSSDGAIVRAMISWEYNSQLN